VIWGGNLVGDEILLHQLLKNPVAEMLTSIIYDCSRRAKIVSLKNWTHHYVVIGLACNNLHPLGHIVHSYQDLQIAIGVRKRSHEINAQNIKYLNN
jgi:hypothetical protein